MSESPPVELHDIESAQRFLDGFWLPWWGWTLVGAAALLLVLWAVGIFLLLRRRTLPTVDPEAIYQAARQDLAGLQGNELTTPELATRVSLVLRRYLAELTRDPALYETREEFIGRSNALAQLSPSERTATGGFFDQLAALKYAPVTEAPDAAPLLERAEALLLERAEALLRELHPSLLPR